MVAPVDARRGKGPTRAQKQQRAEADEYRLREMSKPSGGEQPAWFRDRSLLPRRPPTRSGRPYEAP